MTQQNQFRLIWLVIIGGLVAFWSAVIWAGGWLVRSW